MVHFYASRPRKGSDESLCACQMGSRPATSNRLVALKTMHSLIFAVALIRRQSRPLRQMCQRIAAAKEAGSFDLTESDEVMMSSKVFPRLS